MTGDSVVPLPGRARTPIGDMLLKFQMAIALRWGPGTYRQCQEVSHALQDELETHGASLLDPAQRALLRHHQLAQPEQRLGVCEVFGAAVLGPYLSIFLARLARHEVALSPEASLLAPAFIERIARYLVRRHEAWHVRDLIDPVVMAERGRAEAPDAARLLAALQALAVECRQGFRRGGNLVVGRIGPGRVWLEPLVAEAAIGPVDLPEALSALCREDWTIRATVCCCAAGHHFTDVYHVEPFGMHAALQPGSQTGKSH